MWRYYLAIMCPVVFWGTSYLATALAYETISPQQLGLARAALAGLLFFAFRAARGERGSVARRDWPALAVGGLSGVTLYFAFQNAALAMTGPARAALITACYPAIVLAMKCAASRELPAPRQIAGIAVAVCGVGMLTGAPGGGSLKGDLTMLVPGVMWGVYCLSSEKLAERYPATLLTAWQMLVGAAAFVPLALLEGRPLLAPTPRSAMAAVYLAVCCSLLSFVFFNFAVKGLSVTVSSLLLNLQPVVGVVCSYLALGETVTPFQALGGSVVVAGVLLGTLGVRR